MNGTNLFFLAMALFFAGMAAWGFKTGTMPEKYVDIDRRKSPILFWIGGILWIAFSLLCVVAAFTAK